MRNKVFLSLLSSILICGIHSQALNSECGTSYQGGNTLSSPSSDLVQFKIGGSNEYLKEWAGENVDTTKQRERIGQCALGLSECLKRYPDSNKEGQLLLKITLRDNSSNAQATNVDIKSKDFQNEKFISCVKTYWKQVSFPSLRDSAFQNGMIQVSLQAKKKNNSNGP